MGGASATGDERRRCYDGFMSASLRATMNNGRIVVDEPTDLPEGTEPDFVAADEDSLDAEEQGRLQRALEGAFDELRAGSGVPGNKIIAALRQRDP